MAFDADRVREVAERVAASSGLEVVEVEFRGGGKSRMLRIVIDKPGTPGQVGVTHEDCANMSREVGTILDVEDAVPGGSYLLEVSSPGLDRKLVRPVDYERFTGSRVKLTTYQPVNGNRHFEGRLESFRDGRLTLDLSAARKKKMRPVEGAAQKLEIELGNIEKANLVPEI
ncbi:MAG: ribosome maturation factor [Acidobacteria bacterium]|jgi:ribosome maturation factor RimP|nr:MAG: ribosome maturation factor [Acidobacteriota bacterium]PYX64382.1 MAG: ribosome maturation factor [Acidobacteriota bacterium]